MLQHTHYTALSFSTHCFTHFQLRKQTNKQTSLVSVTASFGFWIHSLHKITEAVRTGTALEGWGRICSRRRQDCWTCVLPRDKGKLFVFLRCWSCVKSGGQEVADLRERRDSACPSSCCCCCCLRSLRAWTRPGGERLYILLNKLGHKPEVTALAKWDPNSSYEYTQEKPKLQNCFKSAHALKHNICLYTLYFLCTYKYYYYVKVSL